MEESRLFGLGFRHLWAIACLVVVPLFLWLVMAPSIVRMYYLGSARLDIEKAWGFTMPDSVDQSVTVVRTEPGGAFAQAGVRPGFEPAYLFEGASSFYSSLACAKPHMQVRILFRDRSQGSSTFSVVLTAPTNTGAWCFK